MSTTETKRYEIADYFPREVLEATAAQTYSKCSPFGHVNAADFCPLGYAVEELLRRAGGQDLVDRMHKDYGGSSCKSPTGYCVSYALRLAGRLPLDDQDARVTAALAADRFIRAWCESEGKLDLRAAFGLDASEPAHTPVEEAGLAYANAVQEAVIRQRQAELYAKQADALSHEAIALRAKATDLRVAYENAIADTVTVELKIGETETLPAAA